MKTPVWIVKSDALAVQTRLLAAHGGAAGIRDEALLESALARPLQRWNYTTPDIVELAAAYTVGIVKNHPFVDGNKRAGFVTGILFLEINGYVFTASEESAAQAVLELAAGTLDGSGFTAWLQDNMTRGKGRKRSR